MRGYLAAFSLLVLLGAGGFVAYSVVGTPADPVAAGDQAKGFDLASAPAPDPTPAPAAPSLRDSVRSFPASSLTPPLRAASLVAVMPAAGVQEPASRPASSRAEAWVRGNAGWTSLLTAPARSLVDRSALGSPRTLLSFLRDKPKVEAYMDSPLVRITLKSPALVKALLGSPSVVRAVLASPALQDPAATRELLTSRMFLKMVDCPAVKEALRDQGVIGRTLGNPETMTWLMANPGALQAIAAAAPALAETLGAGARRSR